MAICSYCCMFSLMQFFHALSRKLFSRTCFDIFHTHFHNFHTRFSHTHAHTSFLTKGPHVFTHVFKHAHCPNWKGRRMVRRLPGPSGPGAQWPGGPVAQWPGGQVAWWPSGPLAWCPKVQWPGGPVAQWPGGLVAWWPGGSVAWWPSDPCWREN